MRDALDLAWPSALRHVLHVVKQTCWTCAMVSFTFQHDPQNTPERHGSLEGDSIIGGVHDWGVGDW